MIFVLITIPGISWGAPGFWHPDEIVQIVDRAIERGLVFDEKNFNYPSLSKHVMYCVGEFVYGLGYARTAFIMAARLISVILGGLIIALTYILTRIVGGGILAGLLAALFLLSNRDLAIYSRFAHPDPYLVFFVILSVIFLVRFKTTGDRIWLYGAFLGVGLATSSKYNGIGLLIAVLVVYLIKYHHLLFKDAFTFLEPLFVGAILLGLGYAIGTPKSLLSMAFYIENAVPAVLRQSMYDRDPDTLRGLFGQWDVMAGALGVGIALLFLIAFIYYVQKVIRTYRGEFQEDYQQTGSILVLILSIVALDLPITISYHYPPRFFLSLIPLLAAVTGLFIEEMFRIFKRRRILYVREISIAVLAFVFIYSFLRVIAVGFLFLNDNRIAASKFLETLPRGTTIEYTSSPPNIPKQHFSKQYEHPIYMSKFADEPIPANIPPRYNKGEEGIENRQPDYLVIDSFTYEDFLQERDENECEYFQLECDFFGLLRDGKTNYQLLKNFNYALPSFLPPTRATFVNPVIEIYQRKDVQGTP